MNKNVVIFASGTGSNAANLVDLYKDRSDINVVGICSNKQEAKVLDMAKANNIDTLVFSKAELEAEGKVDQFMAEKGADCIVLAGFLLRFPARLVARFPNRILNLHPALLPKFGGKGMYGMNVHRAVKEASEPLSGMTIHYVNENYDEGAIIRQESVELNPDDTAEEIAGKVLELEHKWFAPTIEQILKT